MPLSSFGSSRSSPVFSGVSGPGGTSVADVRDGSLVSSVRPGDKEQKEQRDTAAEQPAGATAGGSSAAPAE